ncbi:hypothetical protein DIURU_005766 [Diutina rugosa]|uniref:PWWP domain-containing protein n=1 Tax=Diutina rugosa TaxID=5481 RepID=A0A642UC17_DIURU|nr:uncharacterized protein DIURU_005766 [Diutina rugosa]KAA8896500.1 hypothetical protein DIURU_005766 [Diutina rugosa]
MSSKTKFEPKELVLAKMNGYPAWPAFVMPHSEVPPSVLRAKKKTSNYCVIFIPDGDYYWMSDKNLTRLSRDKLRERVAKVPTSVRRNFAKRSKNGRTNNVNEALLAAEDVEFDSFIQKKRAEDDEDDEEEGEGEEGEEGEEEEEEEEGDTSVKQETDTTGDVSVDTTASSDQAPSRRNKRVKDELDDTGDDATAAAAKRSRNGNGNGTTAKTNANANGTNSPPELSDDERQKQLWQCRIKLQRTLIQRNQPTTPKDTQGLKPPSADELSMARFIMNRLQDFPVTLDLLRQTKIHKVLKCIIKDADLEYPDSFKLHERSSALLEKWDPLIQELKKDKGEK